MTPEKIFAVVSRYETELSQLGVVPTRIDTSRTFGDCTHVELLAHAAYLCIGAKEFASRPEKFGKANRHLTAIQMCLSFVGMYTLDDLMSHNRPT